MTVLKVNCPFAFTQCIAHSIEDPHTSSLFFFFSHNALHIALQILTQAPELQVVFFKLTHIHPLPSAVVLEHQ